MDRRLIKEIENTYPYPIASEFRVLNTEEYLNPDANRLKQILQTGEITVHFLAIIVLSDLIEQYSKKALVFPESFRNEFFNRFFKTTFGKWTALMRDGIKIFIDSNNEMFLKELPAYFIQGKNSETEVQKAFNALTVIRNRIAHESIEITSKSIQNLCIEAETFLEIILDRLSFISNYYFLYVGNVSVRNFKWTDPSFTHSFSEVIGHTSKFSAYAKKLQGLLNTPAIIIAKDKEEDYLNLDPLVIFSDEGENHIPDVFLYLDWDFKKGIKYRPVWNGGTFCLEGNRNQEELTISLLKIIEFGAKEEDYIKFHSSLLKK
jgi:hypothetical protein